MKKKRKIPVSKIFVYFILAGIGFVYLYPVLYMIVNSFLSAGDLTDPSVTWIPTELCFDNFSTAFETLDFFKSFGMSMLMSLIPAVLQTAVTAVVAYGLARFHIPFKKVILVLILITFLLPTQVMLVPRYVLFDTYHLTDTIWAQFLPALFGQGLNSAIFIFVYYSYFVSYPVVLDEAAEIDGAGKWKIFLKLLGITAICYIVFILIGNKLYFRGAVGNLDSGAKKGKNITGKDIKINLVGKSYVAKEFKMLFKNPIFFVQCVLPSVLMPVVFLGIFIVSINSNNSQEAISEFQNVLSGFIETPIGLAAILALTEFLTSMLYIAPTAISRDGQNAIFMKYIPVPYYKQLVYKGIPNVVFGTITSIIVLVFVYVVAKTSILFLLTAFVLNLVLLILQTILMELVDLRKPKLEWSTEYAVVKQNMNLLWPFVLNLLEIGIIFIVSIPLSFTNYLITAVILALLHIIITYFVNRYIYNNQAKLFDKVS